MKIFIFQSNITLQSSLMSWYKSFFVMNMTSKFRRSNTLNSVVTNRKAIRIFETFFITQLSDHVTQYVWNPDFYRYVAKWLDLYFTQILRSFFETFMSNKNEPNCKNSLHKHKVQIDIEWWKKQLRLNIEAKKAAHSHGRNDRQKMWNLRKLIFFFRFCWFKASKFSQLFLP